MATARKKSPSDVTSTERASGNGEQTRPTPILPIPLPVSNPRGRPARVIAEPVTGRMFTPAEAAKRLGYGEDKVRRLCDDGAIRCVRSGSHRAIHHTEVERYLREGPAKAAGAGDVEELAEAVAERVAEKLVAIVHGWVVSAAIKHNEGNGRR